MMNRLLTAMLFAAAYAEDDDDEGAIDKIKNWFSSEQEHGLFDSITKGDRDPYTLSGKYGGYKKFGISFAFIS